MHGPGAADVYGYASVNVVFIMTHHWDTDQPRHHGSMLGLNLNQELKTFGPVEHSVWIIKNKEPKVNSDGIK